MLQTSARLLRLLSLLQSRRDWTGPQLADALGVTTRTVRNDVGRLRALGYPVNAEPGVSGGYQLGVGAELPPLLLDDDEAAAVVIGLRAAASGPVAGIEESAVRALAKLERILPSRLRRRIGTLAAATVALPGAEPAVDAETLMVLAAACRDHERLRFDYESWGGAATRRAVEPHRLVSSARRWYLLGWDLDRDDWRTFRVDRLRLRGTPGPRFAPRRLSDADVAERLAGGLALATWHYRAVVTVEAPAEQIAARVPAAIAVEALGPRRCRVELGSDSPNVLAIWLGTFEADFRIDTTDAPELAERLRLLADRYTRALG